MKRTWSVPLQVVKKTPPTKNTISCDFKMKRNCNSVYASETQMSLLITSTNKKVKLISKIASDLTQLQNSKYLQYVLEKLIS